jgi:hypothetical protein
MLSATHVLTIAGANVVLTISRISVTPALTALGDQLWGRLLGGVNASGGAVNGNSAAAATVMPVGVVSGADGARGDGL